MILSGANNNNMYQNDGKLQAAASRHKKAIPGTSHRTEMHDEMDHDAVSGDQAFLVFDQTSDNGNGMRVHQSRMKMQQQQTKLQNQLSKPSLNDKSRPSKVSIVTPLHQQKHIEAQMKKESSQTINNSVPATTPALQSQNQDAAVAAQLVHEMPPL